MLAVGCALVGAGVLLVGLSALLFGHPRAPRWTRPEVVLFLTMVPITGMIGFGLGCVLYGASALLYGEGDVRELAALVLVPVLVALIWHALGIRGRLRGYALARAAGPASIVATPDVPLAGPTGHPPPSP